MSEVPSVAPETVAQIRKAHDELVQSRKQVSAAVDAAQLALNAAVRRLNLLDQRMTSAEEMIKLFESDDPEMYEVPL